MRSLEAKRLLLVRHGESEWNASRRLQGQADIDLTPRGAEQAKALAPMIAALAPDLALTSDLRRARRTAELLGHLDATPTPALREQDVGSWTGEDIARLKEVAPNDYHGWRAGRFVPLGAEGWETFRERVGGELERLAALEARTILLVCHGGVIRAALDHALGLAPSRIIPVGPASLTILAIIAGAARLEGFNLSPTGPVLDAPD